MAGKAVFYISGHGFGHASRTIEVIRSLRRRAPDLGLIVRTSVPAWFFENASHASIDVRPLEVDTGLAQVDSLTIDEAETARRAVRFYQRFDERVAAEAAWLHANGGGLVVSDVPPLASAAAARAQLPSIVVANFTWDWIYRGLERFEREAPGVLPLLDAAYAATTRTLRLPMHGGFGSMGANVQDIPFIARRSRHGRAAVRAALGLASDRPVALGSFGGHGVRMPYAEAARDGRLCILVSDFEVRANGDEGSSEPFVRCVSTHELAERNLLYEDLVAAADVVVSKPGYGIVSECIANDTALLYTSRGRMVEYDVFVEAMPRLLRCRYISQSDLLAGRWAEPVEALMAQDAPTSPSQVNGADVVAEVVLHSLGA